MSTPQWFAQFEREETKRMERIENIRGEQLKRRDTRDMLFDPTIRAALSHFDDLAPTKRELLIALLELVRAFGAQEGVREVREAIAVNSI